MCTLGWKSISQLLSLLCAATLMGAQPKVITLPELRQIITESQESAATSHLVYIEEINDNRLIAANGNTYRYKEEIDKIRKHRCTKIDAIVDCKAKSVKSVLTDLRDVDALLKENHLPPEQKINVSESRIVLHQDTYEMQFTGADVSNGPPELDIFERPDLANYMFRMSSLGVINKKLLSEDRIPTLTQIDLGGRHLLCIQLTIKGQESLSATVKIECDPSLGYRFRRIQRYSEGRLIAETTADDYRDVNGVPYPFLYVERSFDKDGKICRETKYVFEDVKLGVDLSANDFKIFVPAGTDITDAVVAMTAYKVEQSAYMGIDDVLGMGIKRLY